MPFRERRYKGRLFQGIGIDIIGSCNISCAHCYYVMSKNTQQMLSLKQLMFIMEKAAPFFGEIYLLGGEPTLHPRIVEIIHYAAKRFYNVILVTNGVKLADPKFCQELARHNVSLAMHLRAIHPRHAKLVDQLAGNKGTFLSQKKAWQNVIKYWPEKADKNVQVNLLRPLIDQGCIMEVFRFARKHGFTPIVEMTKSSEYFFRGNPLDPTISEIEKLFHQLRNYDRKYYGHKKQYLAHILSPPSYNHTCTLVETGIHVTVNGSVLPCVGHQGIELGNIFSTDMSELCFHPVLKAIRNYQEWIVGPCRECKYFSKCHGGCRGEAFFATGCPRSSDQYCFNIPKSVSLRDMVPTSCRGCILEGYGNCFLKI